MTDADPRISRLLLAHATTTAALNLADSIRTHGPRRATTLFTLSTALPAFGELLVTGPLGLLHHRTKPRLKGVPIAILLLWYNVICGTHAATQRSLARTNLEENARHEALPLATALVATSLDLVADPFGLDAGLWEWKVDGAYAPEVVSENGHHGVPVLNYWGWLVVIMAVLLGYTRIFRDGGSASRLPVLLLLPQYLASVGWALKRRRPEYLLYSALFPIAAYFGLKEED